MRPSKIHVEDEVKFADIKEWYDANLHPAVLDLNDQEVYKHVYEDGNWAAVFQCIAEDTNILLSQGRQSSIQNINIGDVVVSYNEIEKQFVECRVNNVIDNGYKKCIKLNLSNNQFLILTTDHLVYTHNRGWICAGELTTVDELASFQYVEPHV